MRISIDRITAIAIAALFTLSAGVGMAQTIKPGAGNLTGPKLNVPKKGPNKMVGKQGKSPNKARTVCIKGVFKLAKQQGLKPKGKTHKVKGSVAHACAKLRNDIKPAFKYSVQMGVFAKARKTAGKKSLKSCHAEVKAISKKKNLVPAVKGKKFFRGIDKACMKMKFDGYRALELATRAGLFKRAAHKGKLAGPKGKKGKKSKGFYNKPGSKGSKVKSFGKKSKGKKNKGFYNKPGSKGSKVKTFGKKSKGPKHYTAPQIKKCATKVKCRIKKEKLTAKSRVVKLGALIRQTCAKTALSTSRTFANIRPQLKRNGPKLAAGKKRKTSKKGFSFGGQKGKNGNKVKPIGKKRPEVKKLITECKDQVWKISMQKLLSPKNNNKMFINKKILESCRLTNYIAKRAFPKVRQFFILGKSSKRNVRPIGNTNAGNAAGAFNSINKGKQAGGVEECRKKVLGLVYIRKVKNNAKASPAKMNALANGACEKTKNNPEAAFKILANQIK